MPIDGLSGQKLCNIFVVTLDWLIFVRFEFNIRTDKIGATVVIQVAAHTTILKRLNATGIRRTIVQQFDMNRLRGKTNEQSAL